MRQKQLPVFHHGDDDGRRHPRVIDEAAARADLGPFLGVILGGAPAAAAEPVVAVPVDQLAGPARHPDQILVDLAE